MPAHDSDRHRRGVLVDWNDERCLGIEPSDGGARVFAHISAFPAGRRPAKGCEVSCTEGRDERNRHRAANVRYVTAPRAGRAGARRGLPQAMFAAVAFFALLAGLVVLAGLPAVLLAAYGLSSGIAFILYGADKSAARQGSRRTPESTLHLIDLLGGWPGGLVAQRFFRHKTAKQPFRTVFWVTVVANCAALAWLVIGSPWG